ncbi:MAG: C10 family peptidase, partial [Kiritimatiellae bacterium]|nr:C10 family peptidase [Kiritimatiellia bacterium]
MAEIPNVVKAAMAAANAQWAKYKARKPASGMRLQAAALEGGDSSPYVRRIVDGFESGGRFTHWGQNAGIYNYHTPNNEVCGCVATAGAAILQFFNCTTDVGAITTPVEEGCKLYGASHNCSTIGGEIDWTILPEDYGGESTEGLSEEAVDLLGRATYNMGVLVGMSWAEEGPGSESGAKIRYLVGAFKAYGFKTSRYVEYSGNTMTNGKEFLKTLYAQLWCGAPVALGIRGDTGGHAVVACGYARDPDGDEFCRVFMGWSGSGDAWYKFPAISGTTDSGNEFSFNQIEGSVTMIGYEDDAVVPVFGWTDITDDGALTIPGYKIEDAPAVVAVNEQGYFGIRVPISLPQKDQYVWHEARGKKYVLTPFDNKTLQKDSASRDDLDKAIPNELLLLNLNTDVRSSAEVAREVALRDNKALLMVSGTSGTVLWSALYDSLKVLDSTTDISNKFVLVVTSPDSSDVAGVDGDPSIGVFDPAIGGAELRWWSENGRLAYTNFILSADTQTGAIQYEEPEAIAAAIPGLLEDGYRAYLCNHSDVVVTVTGVDVDSGSDEPFEVAIPIPAYGVSSNVWTNCESIVFSAPGTFTNETAGVIYTCVGWTTNEVFSGTGGAAVYEPGNQVELSFAPGDRVTFTWVWQKTHFRVTAKAEGLPAPLLVGSTQYVTPATVWCAANDRVTFVAEAAVEDYRLKGWGATSKTSDSYLDDAGAVQNGTAISFSVYEPVAVTAQYRPAPNETPPSDPVARTVTVTSEPAEVADFATLSGSLNWGENTIYDNNLHLAPGAGSHIDATGGVWVCTGWIVAGESVPEESLDLEFRGSSLNVVSVWELQEPESPEEPPPEPGPISIKSLVQTADDSWTVTIEGAV